jgi:hypothetical protein
MSRKSVLAATVSAVALVGCGGSSSSSSGANFVTQANNVCSKVNDQIAQLPAVKDLSSFKTTVPKELLVIKQGIANLKSLTPPADKQTVVNEFIGQLQSQAVLSQKLVDAVKTGDAPLVKQIDAQGKAIQTKNHAIANQLGLTECVRNAQPGSAQSSASSTG